MGVKLKNIPQTYEDLIKKGTEIQIARISLFMIYLQKALCLNTCPLGLGI